MKVLGIILLFVSLVFAGNDQCFRYGLQKESYATGESYSVDSCNVCHCTAVDGGDPCWTCDTNNCDYDSFDWTQLPTIGGVLIIINVTVIIDDGGEYENSICSSVCCPPGQYCVVNNGVPCCEYRCPYGNQQYSVGASRNGAGECEKCTCQMVKKDHCDWVTTKKVGCECTTKCKWTDPNCNSDYEEIKHNEDCTSCCVPRTKGCKHNGKFYNKGVTQIIDGSCKICKLKDGCYDWVCSSECCPGGEIGEDKCLYTCHYGGNKFNINDQCKETGCVCTQGPKSCFWTCPKLPKFILKKFCIEVSQDSCREKLSAETIEKWLCKLNVKVDCIEEGVFSITPGKCETTFTSQEHFENVVAFILECKGLKVCFADCCVED